MKVKIIIKKIGQLKEFEKEMNAFMARKNVKVIDARIETSTTWGSFTGTILYEEKLRK